MSWNESFPILDDAMVAEYRTLATIAEQTTFEDWFGIEEIINQRSGTSHLVAASLFWKRDLMSDHELPTISRETMINAKALGLVGRFSP